MENNNNSKFITVKNMNQNIVQSQYAVRGAMVERAEQIAKHLLGGLKKYPFTETLECNVGNPHGLGQSPITFNRQVLACLMHPELIKTNLFPEGVRKRAQHYLSQIKLSVGAYSPSPGYKFVRDDVCKYLEKRDGGVKADPEKILFTDGASPAISMVILAILADPDCGLMIPIPQYPLYSAEITVCGGKQVPYYLDEESGWQVKVEDLVKSYEEATQKGVKVRGIAIINPGNPTGQVLEESTMRQIVEFAYTHNLTILADEVYQENVYTDEKPFVSFKKVVGTMESPYNQTALFSFHSVSKGFTSECGLRGGYVEMHNIPEEVEAQLKKYRTISLAPGTIGQLTMDLMMNPPTIAESGKEVYELYCKERDEVRASLKRKAKASTRIFNTMKNVQCQEIEGSLYAFPKVTLSENAIREAQRRNMAPDLFYTMEALNETGLITVQGSGFGQKPGTFHFRTTILIRPDDKFEQKLEDFKRFNDAFHEKYADHQEQDTVRSAVKRC